FLLLLCAMGLASPPSPAQNEPAAGADMTADELMLRADEAYNKREFPEAAKLYRNFFRDFGKSKEPQVIDIIRRRSYTLAMCLVQAKNFGEAMEEISAALAKTPPLDPWQIQELTFWLGVCQMQEKEYEAAVVTLEKFLGLFPKGALANPGYVKQYQAATKIPEAQVLIGTSLLLQDKFAESAAHFENIKSGLNPADRGRATVLQLFSLIQAKEFEAALRLVEEEYPRMGDLLQLVAFQTLTLELGNHFLENGHYRDAIACLQRVWLSERLLKHQSDRLADLESRLVAAEANPASDPYLKLALAQQIAKVAREVETFQKIENFDSALRLRLATAYQKMKRYRESALIMEDMLEEMSPDPLVEAASVNLVQSWGTLERWPKVIEASKTFAEVFPKSKNLPLVLYLQGLAEQKFLAYEEAVATFELLTKKHASSEFAPRAQFMKGFTWLLAERNADAIEAFETFAKKHPKHELADAAGYWRGMGFSLDKHYETAREVLAGYLKAKKERAYRGAAIFRRAYCAQQMEDYTTSIRELSDYLKKFPGGGQSSEARILLGDALMNEGRMEEGIAAFESIPPDDTRFYEEGVFKVGKALKLMEEHPRMREHMEAFVASSPRSPRVAEAIYNIGWIYRQDGQQEQAREIYWDAIGEYGSDPSIRSVDDLFPALSKLYKGPEQTAQYLAKLGDLGEEATNQPALAVRSLWAQAQALRKTEPDRANDLLVEASALANVQETNPLLLADMADALLASGREAEGETMWRDLVKWNPRAPQKDRAFATLGLLELKRGNEKAAMALFDRFERETLGSILLGKIMLARASLQETRRQYADARKSLEVLLASQYATGPEKCEALYRTGEIYMKEGKPELAVPYFQRIYVMHGRWTDWVARAYYRSGEAFEKLKDTLSARRTYQELAEREELSDLEPTHKARERLQALGGPLPKEAGQPEEPAG
ncbi:MAG: tetratricopeptide repeat protein, partial [Terrimicrobiaceae bacterium]